MTGSGLIAMRAKAMSHGSGVVRDRTIISNSGPTKESRQDAGRLGPRDKRVAQAILLLEDGATYREAALTVRTDEKTLKLSAPGFDNNRKQWNSILAGIKHDDELLELHREIWQGSKYGKV